MDHVIFTYVLLGALAMALIVAAFTDLKSRIISNKLNIAIAAGAPFFWWATGLELWPGAALQLGLAAITFAICALFFAIGQMGGGDLKLLTVLALWFPPTQFVSLVLIMAMVGWVLTLVMGIWGVSRSNIVGARPVRDTAILIGCTLIAALFASSILGGPKLSLPLALSESVGGSVALALVPIAILAIVTLASIRIIRRHKHQPRIPYGLAISMAGLWVVAAALRLEITPILAS
ncbi:MAG: potassium:proton antiporter [Altererythrobacter sp.]|nr:potassium:proton antiporter [Altererythrobacter sp.]MBK61372.1 potassium:proton antiporter [Altererythrobacter sp.]|tara:strand:- start:1241 stop:1942 length:702 start_codon:yes stop_codon:yes gene_type:complete